jgi:hypothetical protein
VENSGLVSRRKQGRVHQLHIEREAMNEALGRTGRLLNQTAV